VLLCQGFLGMNHTWMEWVTSTLLTRAKMGAHAKRMTASATHPDVHEVLACQLPAEKPVLCICLGLGYHKLITHPC
jgi:hypothetical protein